ncbi:MAG TPA: NUDIX hydrolase [Nocardioides sp.]|nr:NUDIX hydrolase [Nocardioides sp.]
MTEQPTSVTTVAEGIARITWAPDQPVDVVRHEVAAALTSHVRVEALVDPDDEGGQRIATWSGLRREGVMRGVTVDGRTVDRIVYARLATDVPVHEPEGFRALLNSFLPRKRAISQMLVRDRESRVLLCQLTYKQDWDLPGGVVEVGESPQVAVAREVEEELGLTLEPGPLLLTDWLPPWSGWDDALCLVFDGGAHDAAITDTIVRQTREIRSAEFCTPEQVRERCADFTARRVASALANLGSSGPAYTESGGA